MILQTLLLGVALLGQNPTETTPIEPEITEPTTPEEGEQTPSDGEDKLDDFLADNNKDGIPDKWADYYDKHIKDDYMFGISLGALLGGAISLITGLTTIIKNHKTNKKLTSTNDEIKQVIQEYDKRDREREAKLKEIEDMQKQFFEDYNKAVQNLVNSMEASSGILANYSTFETKINASLEAMQTLAKDENLMKQGISEEINEIINGVK